MVTLREVGRRMLFWGALLLIVWAGYELSVRWDTITKANVTVSMMANDLRASWWDVLFKYKYIEVLKVPALLAACVLLGLFALLLRNRPLAGFVLIPACLLLAWLSVDAKAFFNRSLWQMLKLLPLLLITLGSVINLVFWRMVKNRKPQAQSGNSAYTRKFQ